jgi:lysophospholipase L1-like esterase
LENQKKIFIAGDSTAADYDEKSTPMAGWGQRIGLFFFNNVSINNLAVCGSSTKSFIAEGRLQYIMNEIKADDYLFIQFGHNDEKPDDARHTDPYTSYKTNLEELISIARRKSAIPVLLTPISRRKFDEYGKIIQTHGEYPNAMKQVAVEKKVSIIDMCNKSRELFENMGEEKTKQIFLWLNKNEHNNYPEGIQDNTHFSIAGATKIAEIIINEIQGWDKGTGTCLKASLRQVPVPLSHP